jgi:acetyl-CoA carboxylase biotin carboxyl carrier protein
MNKARTLEALIETDKTQLKILSPIVGYYSDSPKSGAFLSGRALIGRIKRLNTSYEIVLPEKVQGQVRADEKKDLIFVANYRDELFRLNTETTLFSDSQAEVEATSKIEAGASGISEKGFVVTAFTPGIFYARPSPDAPTFVSEGQTIEKGKALGLIEIMKTFNYIFFQGTGTSDKGIVKKMYVKDAQEIKLGQPLFLIE